MCRSLSSCFKLLSQEKSTNSK